MRFKEVLCKIVYNKLEASVNEGVLHFTKIVYSFVVTVDFTLCVCVHTFSFHTTFHRTL